MSKEQRALDSYRSFLEGLPIVAYEKYKAIKWVEQDLPREMLPLASIFRNYWLTQNYLDFESWFKLFWKELDSEPLSREAMRQFKNYHFDGADDVWFKRGFRGRMYRTWMSVLTQIDFYYIFHYVCAKKKKGISFEATAELDRKGIDLRVGELDFGISKISQRKEARASGSKKKLILLPYAVYNVSEFIRLSNSSRVSPANRIGYRKSVEAFNKYFIQLSNGFVVFGEQYVDMIVRNIDNPQALIKAIGDMGKELSGEM